MESRFRKRLYIFCICVILLAFAVPVNALSLGGDKVLEAKIAELNNRIDALEMLLGTGVGASFYPYSGHIDGGGAGSLDKTTSTDDKDVGVVSLNADHATYPRMFAPYALNVDGAGTQDLPWLVDSGDAGNEDWDLLKGWFYGVAVGGGAAGPGCIEFYEDTDNGANKITICGPSSGSDRSVTLPDAAGEISLLGQSIAAAEVDADVATQAELDAVAALVDTDDEIIAIINASPGTQIGVPAGGTGRATSTTAYGLLAAGTTATGAHQTLAAGATTEILVGGGAAALPVWTTATGSGAPVRATSPSLVTPILGTITSGVGTALTALDGEQLQNDSVDDDSIDFADVTALDITHTGMTNPIATTGLLSGGVVTKVTGTTPYTIGTTNAAECYGGVIYADTAGDVVACDDLSAGMSFSVIVIGDIQVDLDVQSDDLMNLDGVPLNDGDKAVNPAAAQPGSAIVCTYYDATGWYCMSGSTAGTPWADGS